MISFFKSNLSLTKSDSENIRKIINSGIFCNGKYIEKLENHFKEKFNVKYAVACSSCTSGLIVAVKALNIEKQTVLLPAFTWPSTEYAIHCSGNTPIWCDIDLDSWDINPELLRNGWWDAQISVDIFGNESYISKKRDEYNIPTIYDAAHGYGLPNLGHRGDIEVVSLGINKGITCTQGGMILFNDKKLYDFIRELVNLSAKLTEVNAFIGLKSIKDYDKNLEIKEDIRNMYREYLNVSYKEQKIDLCSIYSTYSITFDTKKKRNAVAKALMDNDIEVKFYYEPLISGLKNTDEVYSKIISLPTYKEMIPEVERICKLINEA